MGRGGARLGGGGGGGAPPRLDRGASPAHCFPPKDQHAAQPICACRSDRVMPQRMITSSSSSSNSSSCTTTAEVTHPPTSLCFEVGYLRSHPPLRAVPLLPFLRVWPLTNPLMAPPCCSPPAAPTPGSVTVTFSAASQPANYPAYEDIASYSSVGPTSDGRIKPDIVAPGGWLLGGGGYLDGWVAAGWERVPGWVGAMKPTRPQVAPPVDHA